jgi:urease alpha subunit
MASSKADMELVKLSKVAPKDSIEITQADMSCYSIGKSGNPRLWPEVTKSNASSLIKSMRESQNKQGIVLPEGRCEDFVHYLRKYKVRIAIPSTCAMYMLNV